MLYRSIRLILSAMVMSLPLVSSVQAQSSDCEQYEGLAKLLCQVSTNQIKSIPNDDPDYYQKVLDSIVYPKYHVFNKSALKEKEDLVKVKYGKYALGDPIDKELFNDLETNGLNHRHLNHNFTSNSYGGIVPGHRYGYYERDDEGRRLKDVYEVERSVFFPLGELLIWYKKIMTDYDFDSIDDLGVRVYLGEYGDDLPLGVPPEYKKRSTVLLRPVKVSDEGDITEFEPLSDDYKLFYNLGTLCPPKCKDE